MIFTRLTCGLLAPAAAYAAAFAWSLPEPTHFVAAADNWSPAPTQAPRLSNLDLFRRAEPSDNTCGFFSAISESALTCQSSNLICATNTYYGAHGCCDPSAMSACIMPTTCVPATAMSTDCPGASCSSNSLVAKCTAAGLSECYQWLLIYNTTTMTQNGCAASATTLTAYRSWGAGAIPTSTPPAKTVTVTADPATSPTASPASSAPAKPSIGAIVGGTIGGCLFLSLIAFVVFLVYRKRKAQQDEQLAAAPSTSQYHSPAMTAYDSQGFPSPMTYVEHDHKAWQQQGAVYRESNAVPQYQGVQYGVVEVEGVQRPVEAPT